jgi:hypothetical protein
MNFDDLDARLRVYETAHDQFGGLDRQSEPT